MFLLKIFFLFLTKFSLYYSTLLFTNIHFRHGIRTAVYRMHKKSIDLFGKEWHNIGELTPPGIRQLYLTGVKHYYRYEKFLSNFCQPNEISAFSTNITRTIQSANVYLSGLCSFSKNKKLNFYQNEKSMPPGNISEKLKNFKNNLNFSSIPNGISTIPVKIKTRNEHFFLLHDPFFISGCKAIDPIHKNIAKNNVTKNIINNFKNKFNEKLKKITGEELEGLRSILRICDHLNSGLYNYDISEYEILNKNGINIDNLVNECHEITKYYFSNIQGGLKKVVYMANSPLFKQLIDWMDKRINLDKKNKTFIIKRDSPKYTLWSGHDSSVSTVMKFMENIFNTKFIVPIFGTTLIFELHKNNKNSYYINYFVNDELLLEVEYNEFKNKVLEVLWSDAEINEFCQFDIITRNVFKDVVNKYKMGIVIVGVILLISLIMNIIFYFKVKKIEIKVKNKGEEGIELKENII